MSEQAASPSKTMLIWGIIMIVLGLIGGYMYMAGKANMEASGAALQEMQDDEGNEEQTPRVNAPLTVPGTTSVDLPAGSFAISISGGDIGGEEFDNENYELPPVTWSVAGPSSPAVTNSMKAYDGVSVRGGEFTVAEAGTYEITADAAEDAVTDFEFTIQNDQLAELGEAVGEAAGAIGQGVGGFFQMLLGGLCGGTFGLIGVVLLILHFVRSGKSEPAA